MKGYTRPSGEEAAMGSLQPWESLIADAIGNVIEFWNFKRSHGAVWALLYLRGRPLDAADIQAELGLSKGGVSMAVRELEQWGVVRRTRTPGDSAWHYLAETDFLTMIGKVVAEREGALVDSVARDLTRAEALAAEHGAEPEEVERVQRMRRLAEFVSMALRTFLKTASLNMVSTRDALSAGEVAPK